MVIPAIRMRELFTAAGEAIAKPTGQTLARWLVLETVANGRATVAQIARSLGLTRQSVQRLADVLEQDGLTAYVENPRHRRARLVRLTAKGIRVLRTIQAAQRAWADDVGGEIGEPGLREARAVLERLAAALLRRRQRGGQ